MIKSFRCIFILSLLLSLKSYADSPIDTTAIQIKDDKICVYNKSGFDCSNDKIPRSEVADIKNKISNFLKDKPDYIFAKQFIQNHTRKNGTRHEFEAAGFENFMNSIETSVACNSAINVYHQRELEFKKKYQEAMDLGRSNEETLVSSCGNIRPQSGVVHKAAR